MKTVDLETLRAIEDPAKGIYIPYYVDNRYYENRMGLYQVPGYAAGSVWDRVVIASYGTYEFELGVSLDPVPFTREYYADPFGREPIARYYQGVQTRNPPFAIDDFWAWIYEDIVVLINRYDFDTAKSRCQVDTVEHRQQLGARELSIRGLSPSVTGLLKHTEDSASLGLGFSYASSWIGYENEQGDWMIAFIWSAAGHGRPGGTLYAHSGNNGMSLDDAWTIVLDNASRTDSLFHPPVLTYGVEPISLGDEFGGLPYLNVFSKQSTSDAIFDSQYPTWTSGNLNNHLKPRFIISVGRPKKMGDYKGTAKTVLEFRVYNRSSAIEVSQHALLYCRAKKFSGEVNTFE